MNSKVALTVKYLPILIRTVPSRYIFGNTNRFFSQNLFPYLKWKRKTHKIFRNELSKELVEKGYLCVDSQLSPVEWQKFRDHVKSLFENDTRYEETSRYVRTLLPDQEVEKFANLIYRCEVVQSILSGYYGINNFKLLRFSLWRNLNADSNTYAYSNFWHFDSNSYPSLRIFLNLQDAGPDTGATRVINRKRTKSLVRRFKFTHTSLRSGRSLNDSQVTFAGGRLGTIVFFNPQQILHAASVPITTLSRDALQLVVNFK